MRVVAARRASPSRRARAEPCQDAYAVFRDASTGRAIVAVADGLGSRRFSHLGSQVACDAAIERLALARTWGPGALRAAFRAARAALRATAEARAVPWEALATTLHVAAVEADRTWVASVGDGAIVGQDREPMVLVGPEEAEYANHVVPLTDAAWHRHFRFATATGLRRVYVFTDGLTRLLLLRGSTGWDPFRPFFDSVGGSADAGALADDFAERFLAEGRIDAAWDDDKTLAVILLEP